MRRQIKGYGETLLTRLQVRSVKLVGLFDGAEACVLPDCPGAVRVHGGVGTPLEWEHSCMQDKLER